VKIVILSDVRGLNCMEMQGIRPVPCPDSYKHETRQLEAAARISSFSPPWRCGSKLSLGSMAINWAEQIGGALWTRIHHRELCLSYDCYYYHAWWNTPITAQSTMAIRKGLVGANQNHTKDLVANWFIFPWSGRIHFESVILTGLLRFCGCGLRRKKSELKDVIALFLFLHW